MALPIPRLKPPTPDEVARFRTGFTERDPSECWEWQKARVPRGYGHTRYDGGAITAHRLSYLVHFGVIPAGFCVLHSCDNPPCVNPAHLRLGTQLDNARDRTQRGRQGYPPSQRLRGDDLGRIKEVRRLRAEGLRVGEIARQVGLSHSYVSEILSGRKAAWV